MGKNKIVKMQQTLYKQTKTTIVPKFYKILYSKNVNCTANKIKILVDRRCLHLIDCIIEEEKDLKRM